MVESASGAGWRASCHRRNCRVEMMPSLTDSQTRSSSVARRPMAPIGFEFRTPDGRVHRAMRESGARVPPHCLEAVCSRLRAAQVVHGCQACSPAKLSTSSLLFGRVLLLMSPPHRRRQLSVGWYRYATRGKNLLACRKHRSHLPFLHTAQRTVNSA
jgi:hypothetical protein